MPVPFVAVFVLRVKNEVEKSDVPDTDSVDCFADIVAASTAAAFAANLLTC